MPSLCLYLSSSFNDPSWTENGEIDRVSRGEDRERRRLFGFISDSWAPSARAFRQSSYQRLVLLWVGHFDLSRSVTWQKEGFSLTLLIDFDRDFLSWRSVPIGFFSILWKDRILFIGSARKTFLSNKACNYSRFCGQDPMHCTRSVVVSLGESDGDSWISMNLRIQPLWLHLFDRFPWEENFPFFSRRLTGCVVQCTFSKPKLTSPVTLFIW